jgi:glyoxylase-like metal-dependent hydrolase (beta-lactamase superfamily II)
VEIRPNTFMISTEFWGRKLNLFLLRGDYLFLIDTGLAGMPADLIFPYMREHGLELDDLALFASTHAHADHLGGNAEIQAACPSARLGVHELDRPWVERHERSWEEAYAPMVEMGLATPDLHQLILDVCGADSPVDIAWAGGEQIDLGERRIEVIHAPGHTAGNLVFFDRQGGALIEGETILGNSSGEPGKKGVPGYYDVAAYRSTLRYLAELPWDLLLSSHAAPGDRQTGLAAIKTSLDFVDQIHEEVMAVLASQKQPATLLELIHAMHETYGWAADIGLGTLTRTHLTYLQRTGEAFCQPDGRWVRS